MRCEDTRDWLTQADDANDAAAYPAAVAAHLDGCGDCRALRERINSMDASWRSRPMPAASDVAKAAFLGRIEQRILPRPTARPRSWLPSRRFALAAALFIAVGGSVLFLMPGGEAQAAPDVVEQILDWNLDLSEASGRDARRRLYAVEVEVLRARLGAARLTDRERELADALLNNAAWLAENDDPMEEAQRFGSVADNLLERLHVASAGDDGKHADRLARNYRKLTERGLDGTLERAKKVAKLPHPDQPRKLEKILKRDAERTAALVVLLDKAPAAGGKEIRRVLIVAEKRHKKVEK